MPTAYYVISGESGAPFSLAQFQRDNRDAPIGAEYTRKIKALPEGGSLRMNFGAGGTSFIHRVYEGPGNTLIDISNRGGAGFKFMVWRFGYDHPIATSHRSTRNLALVAAKREASVCTKIAKGK